MASGIDDDIKRDHLEEESTIDLLVNQGNSNIRTSAGLSVPTDPSTSTAGQRVALDESTAQQAEVEPEAEVPPPCLHLAVPVTATSPPGAAVPPQSTSSAVGPGAISIPTGQAGQRVSHDTVHPAEAEPVSEVPSPCPHLTGQPMTSPEPIPMNSATSEQEKSQKPAEQARKTSETFENLEEEEQFPRRKVKQLESQLRRDKARKQSDSKVTAETRPMTASEIIIVLLLLGLLFFIVVTLLLSFEVCGHVNSDLGVYNESNKKCDKTVFQDHVETATERKSLSNETYCIPHCELEAPGENVNKFHTLLEKGPDLIYISLNRDFGDFDFFDHLSYSYINASKDIINPFAWVLVRGNRGRTILNDLPPRTFIGLSILTLKPGVFDFDFHVNTSSCPEFMDACDECKVHLLAEFLLNVTNVRTNSPYYLIGDQDVQICQDRVPHRLSATQRNFAPYFGFEHISIYSIETFCWAKSSETDEIHVHDLNNSDWVSISTWIVSTIIAALLPLIAVWLTPRHPKGKDNMLSECTNLEVGFMYTLLEWGKDRLYPVQLFRFLFLYCPISILIMYPDIIVNNVFDSSRKISWLQLMAFVEFGHINCQVHTICRLLPIVIVVIFALEGVWYKYANLDDTQKTDIFHRLFQPIDYEKKFPIAFCSLFDPECKDSDTDDEDDITEESKHGGRTSDYVRRQALKLLDVSQLDRPRKNVTKYTQIKGSLWCHICIFPLLMLTYLWVLLTYIVSVPGLNVLKRLLFRVVSDIKSAFDCEYKKSRLEQFLKVLFFTVFGFFKLIGGFLLLMRCFSFIILISEIIIHFFNGLIANANIVSPFCILAVVLAGFVLRSVSSIYQTYFSLLEMIIEMVKEIDIEERTKKSASRRVNAVAESLPSSNSRAAENDYNSLNHIEDTLFWYVVEKCKPLRLEVALIILQILLASLAVAEGVLIIKSIDTEALASTAQTISTLIAVWIIPHLFKSVTSSVRTKQDDKILKHKVKKYIKKFEETKLCSGESFLSRQRDKSEKHRKVCEVIIEVVLFSFFLTLAIILPLYINSNASQAVVTAILGIFLIVVSFVVTLRIKICKVELFLVGLMLIAILLLTIFSLTKQTVAWKCIVDLVLVGICIAIFFKLLVDVYQNYDDDVGPNEVSASNIMTSSGYYQNPMCHEMQYETPPKTYYTERTPLLT